MLCVLSFFPTSSCLCAYLLLHQPEDDCEHDECRDNVRLACDDWCTAHPCEKGLTVQEYPCRDYETCAITNYYGKALCTAAPTTTCDENTFHDACEGSY
jgi:hypothetical protein